MPIDERKTFEPLPIAVVTVSDTRTAETDASGAYLASAAEEAGHRVVERRIVPDDADGLENVFRELIARDDVRVVISTGGTGLTGRDVTPEAVERVITKAIPGFGELFRMLSYETIGTSTIQSRACAGLAGTTFLFALPGSTGACKDAWTGILRDQLDSRHGPCNFAGLIPRLSEG